MSRLVTAIMPTRGRSSLAMVALNSFLDQTYEFKQLLILDDRNDPSFVVPPEFNQVAYLRVDDRLLISEKRNVCCQYAAGEIICHFDDDDWSAPDRIANQVERLFESRGSVTGFHSMLFYEFSTGRAAKFIGHRAYALGTSLMYTRDHWQRHKFRPGIENPNVAEDNQFVIEAVSAGEFTSTDAGQTMVATVHIGNTSPKDMTRLSQVSLEVIPKRFFN